MARIFISYSRADRQFVDNFVPLVERVYGKGSLWYDDEIHGGANWWQMILNEIDKCDLFIYLISNQSLESPYCQAELREALRLNKKILPVIVYRLRPPYPGNITDDLADVLKQTQYVDLSGGFRDPNTTALLYAALHRLLNQAPARQPPVQPTPTPEPPVPDKKQPDRTLVFGGGLIAVAVLIGVVLLLSGVIGGDNDEPADDTPEADATTAVAVVNTDAMETGTPTAPRTLRASERLGTLQANQAAETATAQVAQVTQTHVAEETANAAATAAIVDVTETAAQRTIIAMSATPTSTPTATLPPDEAALAAWEASAKTNADWTPVTETIDGVEMVLVPPGCFMMGSDDGDSDEQPIHEICFDEPFWIDRYEVTNAQFAAFLNANGNRDADGNEYLDADDEDRRISLSGETWRVDEGFQQHPAIEVSWYGARDFCVARSAQLPTEAQWEYATRGPDSLVYPWGDEWNPDNANWADTAPDQTFDVGSFPDGASWVGALDLSGNVWEWTSTDYEPYPYDAADGRENESSTAGRVVRGGSFGLRQHDLRGAGRNFFDRSNDLGFVGFRCARPPSQ